MRNNGVHKSLQEYPNLALPPPPRFDATATAAARRVEPLPKRGFDWVYENIRLAPNQWKVLVLTAFVSLTTGGVAGMLIKDGQPSVTNESTLTSIPGESPSISTEHPESSEAAGGTIETTPADVMQSPVAEPQRRNTRLRRASRLQIAEADEDADDNDEDEDRKRKKDEDRDRKRRVVDEDDRRQNFDDRKRRVADEDDDDRREKDRKRDDDDEGVNRSRRAAMLYDVMRMRRP